MKVCSHSYFRIEQKTKYLCWASIRAAWWQDGEPGISLQFYCQKTSPRINWNGYLLSGKKFDCDFRRSFDDEVRARGSRELENIKFVFPSFSSSILTLTPVRVLEILLLFKNFQVVLKHFESLYMNGSNFSSSQHKVWV